MHWAKELIRVLVAKAKQGRVHSLGMASLNNLGSLQSVGVAPGCLLLSRGILPLVEHGPERGDVAVNRLVCISKACSGTFAISKNCPVPTGVLYGTRKICEDVKTP